VPPALQHCRIFPVEKVGFSPVRGPAAKYLKQEYQFGVAVKGGCEAVL
jgi:hypothetical protein